MVGRRMDRAEWAPYRCRTPLFRLIGYFVARNAPTPDHRLILSFRNSHNAAETYVGSILVLIHFATVVTSALWPRAGTLATILLFPLAMIISVPVAEVLTAIMSRSFRFVLVRVPAQRHRFHEATQAVLMTAMAVWIYGRGAWERVEATIWLTFIALNVLALLCEPFLRGSYERLTQRLEGKSA